MTGKWKTAALAVVIVGAGALAITLVSGYLYERVQRARDGERFPQIGRSVDIGGRRLNIFCSGTGSPSVILESGATWAFYDSPKTAYESGAPRPGYSWVRIQRELAKSTTACWYDRAGSGWSDLGPYPRDSASQARDLHALLQSAGVPPPYLLVAESSAAHDARVYTGFYPAEVAGVVFVNGVHPDLFSAIRGAGGTGARVPGFVFHSQDAAAQLFNQIGLFRLGQVNRPAPAPPKGLTDAEWNTVWHLARSSKTRSALLQDIAAWRQSATQAKAAGTLGDRPLTVITSEEAPVAPRYRDVWMELQRELVRLSAHGKLATVRQGGDLIYEDPDAIIELTRQTIREAGR